MSGSSNQGMNSPQMGWGMQFPQSGYGGQMGGSNAPNVSNLIGQAGGLQKNIGAALQGGAGAPDITSLIGNVNTMQNSRNAALNAPNNSFGPGGRSK